MKVSNHGKLIILVNKDIIYVFPLRNINLCRAVMDVVYRSCEVRQSVEQLAIIVINNAPTGELNLFVCCVCLCVGSLLVGTVVAVQDIGVIPVIPKSAGSIKIYLQKFSMY
jgi:hypothetical protein